MNNLNRMQCFISIKEDSNIDAVCDYIKGVAEKFNIVIYRYSYKPRLAENVRQEILKQIDNSIIFICEGTVMSWYVAYETIYAIERKPTIILVQETQESTIPEDSIRKLFPEKAITLYSLRNENDRKKLIKDLEECFDKAFIEIYNRCKIIVRLFNKINYLSPVKKEDQPSVYVDQIIKWQNTGMTEEQVFKDIFKQDESGKKLIAVISPPGGGKSLLLSRFHGKINEQLNHPDANTPLPLSCFINLREIKYSDSPVNEDSTLWPLNIMFKALKVGCRKRLKGGYSFSKYAGILHPFIKNGNIFLLLDGLDEFDKDYVINLLDRCHELSEKGIKVVITCRKYFWDNHVTEEKQKLFELAEIIPFSIEQAIELLKGIKIPKFIIKPNKKTKKIELEEWARVPIILQLISESNPQDIKTKAGLYKAWANKYAEIEEEKWRGDLKKDDILKIFSYTAFYLCEERTKSKFYDNCWKALEHVPLKVKDKEAMIKILNSGFVKVMGSGDTKSWHFSHQSVNEYFLARHVYKDFLNVLEINIPHNKTKKKFIKIVENISKLALSKAQLDYVSATICGFLSQLLEEENKLLILGKSIEEIILSWIDDFSKAVSNTKLFSFISSKKHDSTWELLRNLIEFIGYKYCSPGRKPGEPIKETVEYKLLKIIKDSNLGELVRYNAARALVRIHPSAPQPHFDYYSDWSGKDWGKENFKQFNMNQWAIMGSGMSERKPKQTWMAIDFTQTADPELQKVISDGLFEVLTNPDVLKMESLPINCSFALIQWCFLQDKSDYDRIKELIEQISQSAKKETKHNLEYCLPNALYEFHKEIFKEIPLQVEVEIEKNIQEFSQQDENNILYKLKKTLLLPYPIELKKKETGSTKLYIELPFKEAEQLLWLFKRGILKKLNIVNTKIIGDAIASAILKYKSEAVEYDVFLCHNSENKSEVEEIALRLRNKGIRPWFDKWELRPGSTWRKELEKIINTIKATAVFIGSEGIGPWQDMELNAILQEFSSRQCPVIPCILESCNKKPKLPPFLNQMICVDFGKKNPDPYEQLIWGITGEKLNTR